MLRHIDAIAERLYAAPIAKEEILFHYTSLKSMQSIVKQRVMWASEIHFFSDAAEMRHLVDSLLNAMRPQAKGEDRDILKQLSRWLPSRLLEGHMVFAVSFSVQGNLLSQWRAYCPPAKGVSLGFSPKTLARAAAEQSFAFGKCIYDRKEQAELTAQILESILSIARAGKDTKRHPKNSFYSAFESIENGLLRIGALFKHPAFREENEWRAVSPIVSDYVKTAIHYREGTSTLVPYLEFKLQSAGVPVPLHTVFMGPTPHVNQAMGAISKCLSGLGESPAVFNSQVPYRTW